MLVPSLSYRVFVVAVEDGGVLKLGIDRSSRRDGLIKSLGRFGTFLKKIHLTCGPTGTPKPEARHVQSRTTQNTEACTKSNDKSILRGAEREVGRVEMGKIVKFSCDIWVLCTQRGTSVGGRGWWRGPRSPIPQAPIRVGLASSRFGTFEPVRGLQSLGTVYSCR